MMKKKLNKETITSRAGIKSDEQHGSVVPPLYLSTNFVFDELGKEQAYEYTRDGNPTRDHLTHALSDLESGIGVVVTRPGMEAVTLLADTRRLTRKVIRPQSR